MKLIRFSLPISISISNDRFPISLEIFLRFLKPIYVSLWHFKTDILFGGWLLEDAQVIINRLQLEFNQWNNQKFLSREKWHNFLSCLTLNLIMSRHQNAFLTNEHTVDRYNRIINWDNKSVQLDFWTWHSTLGLFWLYFVSYDIFHPRPGRLKSRKINRYLL